MDHEVRLGNGTGTKVITMRHAPRVGSELVVGNETWLVLSITYEVPYRIPSVSFFFMAKEEERAEEEERESA